MNDFLYRGVLQPYQVRVSYGVTTGVVRDAVLAHATDPVASHLLARALTAGVLSSPLLGEDEWFTMRWNYEGDLQSIVLDVDEHARIRGFIAPKLLMEHVESEEALYGGGGKISVTKSTSAKVLNSGTTEAALLDVVEDLAHFFSYSDQIETAMVAMVGFNPDPDDPVSLCQGLMIQALPDCDLELFDALRRGLNSAEVRRLLSVPPEVDNHFEYVFKAMLQSIPDAVFDLRLSVAGEPQFRCRCSLERICDVVTVLPDAELEEMIESDKFLSVDCRFCSRQYRLTPEQLRTILQTKRSTSA